MFCENATLHKLLTTHFGWRTFRTIQLDAIHAVLNQKSVFVRSATGSGKSLIWQLAAIARTHVTGKKSLTVVVYPTKSLLQEQASKLANCVKSLQVVCLHGDQSPKERHATLDCLELTSSKFPNVLLTVPEYMVSMNTDHPSRPLPPILERLKPEGKLGLIVIDEAQQLLQWGNSFRDAYLMFANIVAQVFQETPKLALSAAITEEHINQTIEKLNMKDSILFSESLEHPSIHHAVRMKEGKHINVYDRKLRSLFQKGQGIIYCLTRKDTAELALGLLQTGLRAGIYHGGLDACSRSSAVAQWTRGELDILVATVAFMFGIDNMNVRWVVWNTLPSSVEDWVQGSGRAGRDGREAWSIVYYRPTDTDTIKNFKSKDNSFDDKSLDRVIDILHDSNSCRRMNILSYFGESHKGRCNNCDNCAPPKFRKASLEIEKELLEGARNIVRLLQRMGNWCRKEWPGTKGTLIDAVLGNKHNRKLSTFPADWHGGLLGCQVFLPHGRMNKEEITILITELIKMGILEEKRLVQMQWRHPYLKLGPKADALLKGALNIPIRFPIQRTKAKKLTAMTRTLRPNRKKILEVSIQKRPDIVSKS